MMKLPDDMVRHDLFQYLTVHDLGRLDSMCMNHQYRPQVLDKIRGVVLMKDMNNTCMSPSLFRWLGLRGIYVCCMKFIDDCHNYVSAVPTLLQMNL